MLNYEDLVAELRKRPLKERLSLLQVLAQSVEEDIAPPTPPPAKRGARFMNIKDFDPNWRPDEEDTRISLEVHAEAQKLAEEIGKLWPKGLSAADAISQDRREL